MKIPRAEIIVTGGGTGGHVFPAIEVAREALALGSLAYFGSLRGQEGEAAARESIPFIGFASEPLVSLRTFRGWRAAARILRAKGLARRALREAGARVVFSTGGFASAPVVAAARSLRIPYILHSPDTIPGRTNRMFGRHAFAVAIAFEEASAQFPGARVVRTGMPVRAGIRKVAEQVAEPGKQILVMGGSQGATAINDMALQAAKLLPAYRWLHVAGPSHAVSVKNAAREAGLGENYVVEPFLQVEAMAQALAGSAVALCRAGIGTLADLAAMRRPSVLCPLPSAFADHQRRNAEAFVDMGAASLILQADLTAEHAVSEATRWAEVEPRERITDALAAWDIPDATQRLVSLINEALSGPP